MTRSAANLYPDWLVPVWPAPPQVRAICTTRAGGVSRSPYDTLNLGTHVADDLVHVQSNRAFLQEALGVQPVFLDQVHGQHMVQLNAEIPHNLQADGAWTRQRGLACTVMVADCLPVLLCDKRGTWVAAVHAGWRGLAGEGGLGVLEEVCKHFMPLAPVNPAQNAIELIAWLGPCIGPLAFEVGPEVRAAFMQTDPQSATCFEALPNGKWLANLPALARQRLQALGIVGVYGNDGSPGWCTVGNPLRFFSHRRDRVCGRQAACIWLD